MSDLISRADAIDVVHKHFVDALDDLPTATDEDGYVVYKDTKSANELLKHNKAISKELKALPSADRPQEDISEDGTLKVNVTDGAKVKRVLVWGDNNFGGLYYPDDRPQGEWTPCELIGQDFIKELADCKDKPYLVTYIAPNGQRYVKKTNIYHGRIQSKENRVIAYMPLPEPYKG